MTRFILFVLATLGFLSRQASGQGGHSEDVHAGRELATKLCTSCHIVRADQQQAPILQPPAPSFEEIAQRSKTDAESLRGFLGSTHSSVSHPRAMPTPQLLDDQLQKVVAYIMSLRKQ